MTKISKSERSILILACLGLFFPALDSGMVNVALPTLQNYFSAEKTTLGWLISVYMLMVSILLVFFNRVAERYGRKRIFSWGAWLLLLVSLGSGYATHIEFLIVCRAIQGIAAAMMQAASIAIAMHALPLSLRPTTLSSLSISAAIGLMTGPVYSGIVMSFLSWSWIFWLKVPVCLLVIWHAATIHLDQDITELEPFNFLSLLLLGSMVGFLLLISYLWQTQGFTSSVALGCYLGLFSTFLLWLVWEKRHQYPVIPLQIFNPPYFLYALISMQMISMSAATILIVAPFLLAAFFQFSPFKIGMMMLATPLGMMFGGRLMRVSVEKIGEKKSTLVAACILFLVSGFLVTYHQLTSNAFGIALFFFGMGSGLMQSSMLLMSFWFVPQKYQATTTNFTRMLQYGFYAVSVSISTLLMHKGAFQNNWKYLFVLICISCAMVLILCFSPNVRKPVIQED